MKTNEEIKLIQKIVWSFVRTSELNFEEVFQEAAVAFYSAKRKYENNENTTALPRACGLSVRNRLIDLLNLQDTKKEPFKKQENRKSEDEVTENLRTTYPTYKESVVEDFPKLGRKLAELVIDNEQKIDTDKGMQESIFPLAREHGWQWKEIHEGTKEIKNLIK